MLLQLGIFLVVHLLTKDSTVPRVAHEASTRVLHNRRSAAMRRPVSHERPRSLISSRSPWIILRSVTSCPAVSHERPPLSSRLTLQGSSSGLYSRVQLPPTRGRALSSPSPGIILMSVTLCPAVSHERPRSLVSLSRDRPQVCNTVCPAVSHERPHPLSSRLTLQGSSSGL